MKIIYTDYGNNVEILKFVDHYVGQAIQVADTGVSANEDGKKIVPAGALLKADGTVANDGTVVGVLLHDVDVTYGSAAGTIVVHGFIDNAKLAVKPSAEAKSALPMVMFID